MKYLSFFILITTLAACNKAPVAPNYLTAHNLKGKVKQLTEYYYDNEQAYKTKQQSGKEVSLFDINGDLLNKTRTDGKFITKTIFKNGRNVIADTTYLNDTIAGTEKQKLDQNGRVTELHTFTGDPKNPSPYSNFTFYSAFKYDENGNRVETDNYDGKKITSKTIDHYDDKDQLVEEDMYSNGAAWVQTGKTTYAYDTAGNQIKQTSFDAAGKLVSADSFAYNDFDKEGNWRNSASTTTDSTKSSSKTFVVREIEYFQ